MSNVGFWDRSGYLPSSEVYRNVARSEFVYGEVRVSDAEFARRHRVMREFMDRHGLDCLLIGGGSDVWNRGFNSMRWVTNHIACELSHYEYVVFPRQGEITILTIPMYAGDPARRIRAIVEDVRRGWNFGPMAGQVIKEKGYEKGKIGIVEIAMEPGIPHNHWQALTQGLPEAELATITREWWSEVRYVKSDEEIDFLQKSALIGDKMMEAIAENIRAGMTEADVFAVMDSAMIRHGGEIPTMVLAVTFSMHKPAASVVRETPINRVLQQGDIILTEVAPRYPDGSECQTGRTFCLGEPTEEYARMIDVMWQTQRRVVEQLRPGRNKEDLRKAIEPTIELGYIMPAPLIHSDLGGGIDSQPFIKAYDVMAPHQTDLTFRPGMVVTPETYITTPDTTKGVYTLDTYVITDGAPRCLHKFPREVVIL